VEFVERWEELERKGFRSRLEYALDERPGGDGAMIDGGE
jgi:hypothetical protein